MLFTNHSPPEISVSPSTRAETCCFSTLPSQVCRLHPPFTWDSGVQTPPSLYLGLRCADSTFPLPGSQVCRLHPPFTWESGVQTPPSLYLGLRCADSTLPLPGTQVCRLHPPFTWDSVCRLHPPFTWESGVQTPPSLYLGVRCERQSGQSVGLITREKRKPGLDWRAVPQVLSVEPLIVYVQLSQDLFIYLISLFIA